MNISLQTRLLLLMSVALAIGVLVTQQAGRYESRRTAAADIDARLGRVAHTLLLSWQVSNDLTVASIPALTVAPPAPDGKRLPVFEVTTFDNRVLLRSHDFPLRTHALRAAGPGYGNAEIENTRWRVFTVIDSQRRIICRVALNEHDRSLREATLAPHFDQPLLLGVPLILVLGWMSLVYGLRPLRRLSRELARRDATDLAPIRSVDNDAIVEIRALRRTLDGLFERLRHAVNAQRLFTAAAGHELRTPLAGLRTQIEVAQRAPDAQQQTHALERIARAGEHMEKLVSRLLHLARLDSGETEIARHTLDLAALVARISGDYARVACDGVDRPAELQGDAPLLEALVTNLLDNACRHAPTDTPVEVTLAHHDHWLTLHVRDHGPGLPEADRARAFDVFYRGENTFGEGSGLGLALVRAIARAHGGHAGIDPPSRDGLCVTVRLPAAHRS